MMSQEHQTLNAPAEIVPAITGQTRLLAIVGDPIGQVRSPEIYNPRIGAAGHKAVLLPVHLPAADFEVGMQGLMAVANLDGLVVTFPFKERALPFVDHLGVVAGQVGALNAMRREADGSWSGDMFDGAGLVGALAGLSQSARGRRILLLGAGGAGSAIAMAVAGAGAQLIGIFDSTRSRAEALATKIMLSYPHCSAAAVEPDVAGYDLLINATPVGMAPEFALAPFTGQLHPDLTVIDIVPKPEKTRLLEMAQAAGCPTTNGQAMISGQADAVLSFFGIGKTR